MSRGLGDVYKRQCLDSAAALSKWLIKGRPLDHCCVALMGFRKRDHEIWSLGQVRLNRASLMPGHVAGWSKAVR